MGLKSEHEGKLLDVSKTFDKAISNKDASLLKGVLADDVVVHHDGITLGQDIVGADAVTTWVAAFPEQYHYDAHNVIAGAVDENDNTAFSFYVDKGVKPAHGDQSVPSTDTCGIWHHQLNRDDKISHIYFLRQLSHDELQNKMKEPPPQKTAFDPSKYISSDQQPDEKRAQQHEKAAQSFNDIWAKQDASAAADIMTNDVTIFDPVLGSETHGRQKFEKMIEGFSKGWESKNNESRVAVTPGDKAFIYWKNTGKSTDGGSDDTLYGLNMLVFNADGLISDVIGFRQLTKSESESKVKPSVQRA